MYMVAASPLNVDVNVVWRHCCWQCCGWDGRTVKCRTFVARKLEATLTALTHYNVTGVREKYLEIGDKALSKGFTKGERAKMKHA